MELEYVNTVSELEDYLEEKIKNRLAGKKIDALSDEELLQIRDIYLEVNNMLKERKEIKEEELETLKKKITKIMK